MQHLIYCKKCNHHTTVNHLEWTAIICQSCGAEISSQTYIDLLLEKIENRDLNLAHRDRLINILETNNRALSQILESLIGKPLNLRSQPTPSTFGSLTDKLCPDCNYEEWVEQEDAKSGEQ